MVEREHRRVLVASIVFASLVLLPLTLSATAMAQPCDAPGGGTCDASGGGTGAAGGGFQGASCDAPSGGSCDILGSTSASGGSGSGGPRFNFGAGNVAPAATAVTGNFSFTG
jgi:hypothetical protein